MATAVKMFDGHSVVAMGRILRQSQTDDIMFGVLFLFTGLFYTFYLKEKPDPYHHIWYEKPQAIDANARGAHTRDIGLKLVESKKDLVVFWGSQSGTAEQLANRLVQHCRSRFGLDALSADLSDYDPETIANIPETKLAIFILSTYGDGDPSDNATQFFSWLASNKEIQLPKLQYAAFGLGNSRYKFYNRVVDVVVENLDRLGGNALMPVRKADDANGATDEDFIEWKQSLFDLFRDQLKFQERPEQYVSTIRVIEDTSLDIIDLHVGEPLGTRIRKKEAATISPTRALSIMTSRKLLTITDKNCLHMELDINDYPELKYKTGDHLAVWPSNPTSEIQRLVRSLGLEGKTQTPLLVQSLDRTIQLRVPSPTTWSALFQYYLEICAPVPRETVCALVQFAPTETAELSLKHISEDKDTYHKYCSKTPMTFGRLLESVSSSAGSWSNLPLSFILESLPTLQPRYYSISSSSIVSPKRISITVATSSEVSSPDHASNPGLTTNYLLAIEKKKRDENATELSYCLSGPNNMLDQGGKLYAHIRKSKFRLPSLPKHPIIMISSGSGVAPFRAFLIERARIAAIGREPGKSLLILGFRSPKDYLYQDELEAYSESNKEIEVVTAFSRTQKNGRGGKCYVQDRVEEKAEEIATALVEQNAFLFICGSAAMARDVAARLSECMKKRLNWSETEVGKWSEGMRRTHRWQEDVWG